MRRMVGILLLANLALFGWIRWGSLLTSEPGGELVQPELVADQIRLLPSLPSSAVTPASDVAGVSLPPVSLPSPALALALALSSPAPSSSSQPAPLADSLPVVQPDIPSGAAASVPASAPIKAEPVIAKATDCAEWGEFSGTDLKRAQEALMTLRLGEDVSRHTIELDHGFWVYIPPLKGWDKVRQKIAELRERGVNDYFVVREKGKWQYAISLGVFKTREAAQKHLETLHARDVRTARIGERKSKLQYTVFRIKGLDSGTLDKLEVLQKDFPDSELKLMACED